MTFPDETELKQLRQKYLRNARIVLDKMDDAPYNQAPPKGAQGTVYTVDDVGDIVPVWDEESTLKIIYNVDECHVVSTELEAETSLNYFGAHWEWGCCCPRCGKESRDKHLYALSRRARINICESCSYAEALESFKADMDIGNVYDSIPGVLGRLEWAIMQTDWDKFSD